MKNTLPIACLVGAGLILAGCAGNSERRYPRTQIDRALSTAQYTAQPSLVVAREIEFARAAREDGQWTAFRAFATDDAVLHGRNGPVPARPVLATLEDPEKAVQWSPRTVMMSCDGRMAVSTGRFREPDGLVGDFVTVWERDGFDDEYEWSYDAGGLDDPQPAPEEVDEDAIVVTAYDAVQGLVADCPKAGETIPAPVRTVMPRTESKSFLSPDKTLLWEWFHFPDGRKAVRASYWKEGDWQLIVNRRLNASED
ncbi:MAG: hypothetical protein CL808_01625 [Citromicrobium sp.]|nr:hypothetical protein [Citromicrobium sp.]